MQVVDFFAPDLVAYETEEPLFFLSDKSGNDKVVEFSLDMLEQPVSVNVKNEERRQVKVVPVDHNVKAFREGTRDMESLCDYLMTVDDTAQLIFGEIKTGRKSWASDGAKQISNTLRIFKQNHDLSRWNKCKAYVSNRRYWKARESHRDIIGAFRDLNGLPLFIQNEVVVD